MRFQELRRLEAEFDAHVKSTVESVMRTPEQSRSPTPIPDEFPDDDEATATAWMDTDTNEEPEQPQVSQQPVLCFSNTKLLAQ